MPGARFLPRAGHETISRYLLGTDHANALGIPAHRPGVAFMRALAVALKAYGLVQRLPFVAPRLEDLGRRCLRDLATAQR